MLQIARLSPKLLGDSRDLVESFVRSQLNPDGAFCNRAGESDLYYTVFSLEALVALQSRPAHTDEMQPVSTHVRRRQEPRLCPLDVSCPLLGRCVTTFERRARECNSRPYRGVSHPRRRVQSGK